MNGLPPNPQEALGIIRVSRRNRNKTSGHSPEVQRRLITQYAERNGWILLDVLNENDIRDGNVSGGADLSQRPGFGPAVRRVECGEATIIVAAEMSRLFRELDVQRSVIAQIEQAGGELWTVSDGRISHETADSELNANLKGSVNHHQRRYAKDKSFLAVEIAIEQGKVPWHQTPIGYDREDGRLVLGSKADQRIATNAFNLRADGATISKVREHLASHGYERSIHGTTWMLRDRLYLGEIHFGRHAPNLTAHPAIIDRDLFDAAQKTTGTRARRHSQPGREDRLLCRQGLLRCATCGSRMTIVHTRTNDRLYPSYRCPSTHDKCSARAAIASHIVEDHIVADVRAHIRGIREHVATDTDRQVAVAQVDELSAKRSRLIMAFAEAGVDDDPMAIEQMAKATADLRAAEQHLASLRIADDELLIEADQNWDDLSMDAQRAILRQLLARVVVRPGRGAVDGRVTITPISKDPATL